MRKITAKTLLKGDISNAEYQLDYATRVTSLQARILLVFLVGDHHRWDHAALRVHPPVGIGGMSSDGHDRLRSSWFRLYVICRTR